MITYLLTNNILTTKILTVMITNFPSTLSLTRVLTTSINMMVTCNPLSMYSLNPFLNMYLNLASPSVRMWLVVNMVASPNKKNDKKKKENHKDDNKDNNDKSILLCCVPQESKWGEGECKTGVEEPLLLLLDVKFHEATECTPGGETLLSPTCPPCPVGPAAPTAHHQPAGVPPAPHLVHTPQ